MRRILIAAVTAASLASNAAAADSPHACGADALGVSRVAVVGDQGPVELGLKTYPRTLQLADHEVVLTFDDGPSRRTTPRVLAALAAQCVHATFFLIGRNAAAAPVLVRQEVAEGHTVGHHTFSHPKITMRGLPDALARVDIDKGFAADDKAAYGVASANPRVPFFRFPGFADTAALDAWLASRHIEIFGADLWGSDWQKMTPDEELSLLMRRLNAAGRGIILLHDVKEQTAAMLPSLLQALKASHFHIVHMIPGTGPTPTEAAAPGWHSETENTIASLWPKLVLKGARSPMPQGEDQSTSQRALEAPR